MVILKLAKMNTLLLLDIRDDLVFDKHSGDMIGFTYLGDITNHLVDFEKNIFHDKPVKPKTMLVFMVRGLFTSPYAQFPCAELRGDLLHDSFW